MAAFGVEAQLMIHPVLRNRQERVYKMGNSRPGHRLLRLEKEVL
jgi:hypothetical protein